MPRVENLVGFQMGVAKSHETDEPADGELETVEVWTLVFTDRQSGDQIRIAFRRDARDTLVRQLTGGVVLAGGEFPKL